MDRPATLTDPGTVRGSAQTPGPDEPGVVIHLLRDVYTVAQVATLLSLSVQTVYQLIATGRLGHLRVGTGTRNSYRVTRDHLAGYLRRVNHDPEPPPPAAA